MKLRNTFSVITGVVVGVIIIILGQGILLAVNPLPEGVLTTDHEAFKSYISAAPVRLHLAHLGIYALSSFVGGLIASAMAVDHRVNKAITLGGIFMGLGMLNLVSVGHPIWVVIVSFFAFLPFSWLGGVIVVKFFAKKKEA